MQMILQLFIQKELKVLFDWKKKAFFYTQLHLLPIFLNAYAYTSSMRNLATAPRTYPWIYRDNYRYANPRPLCFS